MEEGSLSRVLTELEARHPQFFSPNLRSGTRVFSVASTSLTLLTSTWVIPRAFLVQTDRRTALRGFVSHQVRSLLAENPQNATYSYIISGNFVTRAEGVRGIELRCWRGKKGERAHTEP